MGLAGVLDRVSRLLLADCFRLKMVDEIGDISSWWAMLDAVITRTTQGTGVIVYTRRNGHVIFHFGKKAKVKSCCT